MKITMDDYLSGLCMDEDGKPAVYRSLLDPWLDAEGLSDQRVIEIEVVDEGRVRITCPALNEGGRPFVTGEGDDRGVAIAPPRTVRVGTAPPALVPLHD